MMDVQNSFRDETTARLYLVPTPIGNLGDMTIRALEVLRKADIIAAEDTRTTRNLCRHFGIETPLISYHEHNLEAGGARLLDELEGGARIALVSDAGMPCISDPGARIAEQALAAGFPVIPLPGANAALSALIASGLPAQPFAFYGFLDRQKKRRRPALAALADRRETLVFYEAPHRLCETLADMESAFGGERRAALARELTKKFEEFARGTLAELRGWAQGAELRGEFCVVVEGAAERAETESAWWAGLSLVDHVEALIAEEGLDKKAAIRRAADERGLQKREVYNAYHAE